MGEFFNFVLTFMHRCFRGKRGVVAFSSMVGALFYLGLWQMDQHLSHPPDYEPLEHTWWFVITPLTLVSAFLIFSNYRRDCEPRGEDRSHQADQP